MSLSAYLPIDRYQALIKGLELPDYTLGAALFADISGFTPLTETLAHELGPRRGGEELTRHLNTVYEALIAQVHRYHGSVLSFSGDAITCWFDAGAEASPALLTRVIHQAAQVALEMQTEMQKLTRITTPQGQTLTLALKVAVAAGTARRFVVGAPEIQLLDVLAGSTLERLAEGEHLANKGEVVLAPEVYQTLAEVVEVQDWREDHATHQSYAVVAALKQAAPLQPWPDLETQPLVPAQLRPWLLPAIYERSEAGLGDFLTELRPTTALFLRFGGLNYDSDPEAGRKLEAYIRWVQQTVTAYDGSLLQITIGDKGSYLYVAFGAPVAHENDAERGVRAGLALLAIPPELGWVKSVQIGLSMGAMRIGAYGAATSRHTYGVLGDEVNLAARLMQAATPGQLLVSDRIQNAVAHLFPWESLPPLKVKGKAGPVTVYRVAEPGSKAGLHTPHLSEPLYKLPIIGREKEVATIQAQLETVLQGQGRIVAIIAESGMGKSRLIAETIRMAKENGLVGYGGECQSYGTNTSYLVWQPIWRSFFGIDPDWSAAQQINQLEQQLWRIDPALLPRLPLLGAVLNLPIPDNELTRSFDARLRKASLEALLVDCFRASVKAEAQPTLLVLEDCHWLDPLSHDLLEAVGRAITDLPVLMALAYRPPDLEHLQAPRITTLPHATSLELQLLTTGQAERLIALKIGQGDHRRTTNLVAPDLIERLTAPRFDEVLPAPTTLPPALVALLTKRAEGHPFYLEELLNYLWDKGVDFQDEGALADLELPDSLHTLVLSRIDQLKEVEKVVLKVASIIGRLFKAAWVSGAYPSVGVLAELKVHLDRLNRLDITPLDKPEPELEYLFKHAIMREVAYESLPFAMRTILHGQLGEFLESQYRETLEQYVDLLAYHYDLSENAPKRREYLRKAGEAAQSGYANLTAIDYYRRLLPLLPEAEQIEVKLRLGQVLELVSQWDEAGQLYQEALQLAETHSNRAGQAQCLAAIGGLRMKQKRYAQAEPDLRQALQAFQELGEAAGVSQVMTEIGEVYRLQGKYSEAHAYYDESLRLAEDVSDPRLQLAARAKALKAAGSAAVQQGNYPTAKALFEESLALLRELGDKPGIAALLNNLGVVARYQENLPLARRMSEESLALLREVGNRWAVSMLLNNLGMLARDQNENGEARRYLEESLEIYRRLGDEWGIANTLSSLGDVLLDEGDLQVARQYLTESLQINRELNDPTSIAYLLEYFAGLAATVEQPGAAVRLAGAAASLRESIGAPLSPAEQAVLERRLGPLRQTFPDYGEAWEAGQKLTLNEAIDFALSMY